jgi:hypothetical protein
MREKLKYMVSMLLLTGFIACEEPVTFTEPQPAGTADLEKFPKRLQGNYRSTDDNSVLIIDDKLIQRVYDFDQKMHKNQLDSNSRLSGDTLINLKTKERILVTIEGDSILNPVNFVDTIFWFDADHLLRKYKGYYFLNSFTGKGWEVMKLEQLKGELTVSTISPEVELESLKEITESPEDTTSYRQFTLTKKQFQDFVKKGGFGEGEKFVKQKKQ